MSKNPKPQIDEIKTICKHGMEHKVPVRQFQAVWSFKDKPNDYMGRKESPTTVKDKKVY